ncbi:ABC-three component system middle component 1 [Paenisporosarcina sp. NPDC076898]|uniref:ABC-three component system middle component 1 n=1 Tax=unclassified Paenisporosarcina TaxID=2642018 RepID=UPI003CFCA753
MKNILRSIFLDNNFIVQNFADLIEEEAFFASNYQNDSVNFYLVVFLTEISEDFLINKVPDYYNKIKSLDEGYDERIDKNLSMLVCLKQSDRSKDKIMDLIFEIEEDPYYFKKYVISYSQKELENLSSLFNEEEKSSNMILNDIVNNSSLFSKFKNSNEGSEAELYDISSKLLIKVPFIRFQRNDKQLDDLALNLKTKLESEKLHHLSKYVLTLDEESDECVNRILEMVGGEDGKL